VLFLFHDKTLERTTNGSGRPIDFTWSELSALDAGSWFSQVYAGERLVALVTFLQLFAHRELEFALELKAPGIEEAVLDMIEAYHIRSKVTVTAFSFEALCRIVELDRARGLSPVLSIGHFVDKIDQESIDRLLAIGATQICPKADQLTAEDVVLAKQHGLTVRTWGTHSLELMDQVLRCQVDGSTINFPDKLKAAIKQGSEQ
jgi:glycerophosphoryl diester phosphodiesterase